MDDHETPQRVLGKKGKKSVKVGKIVLIVDPTGSKTGEKRWRVSFVRRENAKREGKDDERSRVLDSFPGDGDPD